MEAHQSPPSRRQGVESTSLASVGYDLASRTLEVEFHKGGVYRYFGVPSSVHESLMKAPSKGRFFVTEVRDRFPYSRTLHPALA